MYQNPKNTMAHATSSSVQQPQSSTATRGLPTRDALRELVTTYLEHQAVHWPELRGSELIPLRSVDAVERFADQFETAYRTETATVFVSGRGLVGQSRIGAAYVRYSDSNSNTRSLDQQLIKVLATARQNNVFIPWSYVFADAAISATTAARPGYRMLESVVSKPGFGVECVVADELDRLNRNQEDSLRFARLTASKRVQVITSNGYDSKNPNAKVLHSFTSLHNELHIDSLRGKVNRGMCDTFDQGKNVGLEPLGYKSVPDLDDQGNVQINRKDKVIKKLVIDDEAAEVVRRIFKMYARDKMSPKAIARTFNDEEVLGKVKWCQSGIAKILTNRKYIGQFVWRETETVTDPVTGKHGKIPRPAEEHRVRDRPEMRIVSDEDWAAVCQRRTELARKVVRKEEPRMSRQSQYATRLFDLYCGYCKNPLCLTKAGEHPQVHCSRATEHIDKCKLHNSKSLKIIDECLLGTIEQHISDDATVEAIVHQANAFLAEEAARPPVDTVALEKKIRTLNEKLTRMAERVADLADGPAADALMTKIQSCETERKELVQQRELASRANFRPQPLSLELVKSLLSDLVKLLRDDVVAAHGILAKAFGRIEVTLGEKRGSRQGWIAHSNVLPVPVLIELARRKNCPSTNTLEYLCDRSWTIDLPCSVDIRFYSNAERLAKTVYEMRSSGTNVTAVAVALGVDSDTVVSAYELWESGARCCIPLRDYKPRRELPASRVAEITQEVVRLIDEEGMSIASIAKKLKAGERLVSRAYKQSKGDQAAEMAKAGKAMRISPPLKLSREKHKRIRELLLAGGMSYRAIAREVGCAHQAVSEAHKRMKAEVAA